MEWWWWREAWLGLSRDWPWLLAQAPFARHWDQRPAGEPGLPRLVSEEQHLSGGEVHQGPLCPVQLALEGLGFGTGCGSPNPRRPPRPGRGATLRRTRAAGAGRGSSYSGGGHWVIPTWLPLHKSNPTQVRWYSRTCEKQLSVWRGWADCCYTEVAGWRPWSCFVSWENRAAL